jgi:hypothetical protein
LRLVNPLCPRFLGRAHCHARPYTPPHKKRSWGTPPVPPAGASPAPLSYFILHSLDLGIMPLCTPRILSFPRKRESMSVLGGPRRGRGRVARAKHSLPAICRHHQTTGRRYGAPLQSMSTLVRPFCLITSPTALASGIDFLSRFTSSGEQTMAMPTPMLNTRYISASAILPRR